MLLALEGPKGVGKTTVMTALRTSPVEAEGRRVVLTKEPTRNFDLAQETRLSGIELARAIAADRAQHVAEVIRPALEACQTVICDRYILSSLVFHSIDGVQPEKIWHLNEKFPLPDIILLLTASAAIIRSRRHARPESTRLESASTLTAELDAYARFGQDMQEKGCRLRVMRNETPDQLARVLQWITWTINKTEPQ